MVFFLFESTLFIVYLLIILIAFIIHKFFLFALIKQYFSSLSLYILIISLLASNDLLLNFIYENISHSFMYLLLILDGILTGTLLTLIIHIYTYSWSIFHLFLTMIILLIANYYHLNQLKKDSLLTNFVIDIILLVINFLHIFYCFLNGLQTYMHRILALSGMCLSFYMILFQQFNIEFQIPLPMIIMHFVQSIRTFFLYSVVICVRNRTSYW
jgi:hypothetical protein